MPERNVTKPSQIIINLYRNHFYTSAYISIIKYLFSRESKMGKNDMEIGDGNR
jgi:hypothetical protein